MVHQPADISSVSLSFPNSLTCKSLYYKLLPQFAIDFLWPFFYLLFLIEFLHVSWIICLSVGIMRFCPL